MRTIVVNYVNREKRYAILEENSLKKLVIQQPNQQSLVGSIFVGIVTKVLPGLQAAFVDIGGEKQGFIHRDKLVSYQQSMDEKKKQKSIQSFVHQGEKILVQVEKDATGEKGPRLTGLVELGGTYCVFLPGRRSIVVSRKLEESLRERLRQLGQKVAQPNEGFILRTLCTEVEEETVVNEMHSMRELYTDFVNQAKQSKKPVMVYEHDSFIEGLQNDLNSSSGAHLVVDDLSLKSRLHLAATTTFSYQSVNLFHEQGIDEQIQHALKRTIETEIGVSLVFDETEALTVIDVNTGSFSAGRNLEETVRKANGSAAREIARQIQLRDIGGIILIDFIDMVKETDRQYVKKQLEHALVQDDRTKMIGFTELGIMQLTRQKTKVALSEQLLTTCPLCLGTGKVESAETMAFRLERELWEYRGKDKEIIEIETTAEVKNLFCGENDLHLKRVQALLGVSLLFAVIETQKPFYRVTKLA